MGEGVKEGGGGEGQGSSGHCVGLVTAEREKRESYTQT